MLSGFATAMFESYVYRQLSFNLFNDLKKDLPNGYMITTSDINLLIMLDRHYGFMTGIKPCIALLDKLHKDKLEREALYRIHCDPYELFIDAGRIDRQCKITKKGLKIGQDD